MRIVAVSDMHGDTANIFRAVEENSPDLLLCCGDWGDPGEISAEVLKSLVGMVHILSVYGNHDDIELLSQTFNADGSPVLLAPGVVVEYGGLRFAGINGIRAKSHRKPHYVTDEDVAAIAARLKDEAVDVLLTHGCAIGLADAVFEGRRGGQRCFLDAFHAVSPRLYLCGHLHVAQERTLNDGRVIINTGNASRGDYWIIEIDSENLEFDHLRFT